MATQGWLQQVRDEPIRTQTFSVDLQPSVTVFRVPELPRAMSPAYHERRELQLGLHNRSLQTSGSQLLKLDIDRCLHARLLTASSSWEEFAATVVGDVQTARGHYQYNGKDHLSDEVVPFLLALDALFLVVFFQFMNGKRFFLKEDLKHLGPRLLHTARHLSRQSDWLLLENQLPMYLLKNVVAQLIAMCASPTDTEVEIEIQVANELDMLLKMAVEHLNPLGRHDESESMSCFLHLHKGHEYNNNIQRFYKYLDEKYPLDDHPLQHLCKHVLDCVYVVVCGHSSYNCHPQLASPPGTRLDSIPSVSHLQAIGITITDTTPTLNKIELSGCGYVTSAKLNLPKVIVYEFAETVFHNLALHEQLKGGQNGDLRCFLQCMASLSNNPVDLALLIDHGVMDNKVGDNAIGMYRIMREVDAPRPSKSWLKCYQDIHNHRRNWLKRWRREVWMLFFSTPWTFVGLLGAIAILFFSAVQTWFAVVNASNRSWHWPSAG